MKPAFLTLFLAVPGIALAHSGIHFNHGDWELACDNTGTCRAAGYQHGEDPAQAITVLLTREAGADSSVSARVALPVRDGSPAPEALSLQLQSDDGAAQTHGDIALKPDNKNTTRYGDLDAAQTEALLTALKAKSARITLSVGDKDWKLSPTGSTAVLLKMDDYQQRVGTPSALIRPGKRDKAVLAPQAAPVIRAAAVPATAAQTLNPGDADYAVLRQKLAAKAQGKAECSALDGNAITAAITLYPLNSKQQLAETPCWIAAYNTANLYAIISADRKTVQAVAGDPNDSHHYQNGVIEGGLLGRGLGDCANKTLHIWDGKTFVLAYEGGSEQCKGFPGGAWKLPTRVSKVVEAKAAP